MVIKMIVFIIIIFFAAQLLVMGLLLRKGKGLWLLAGFNTTPQEERDKIDKKELSQKAGNMLLRMALEFMALGAAIYLEIAWAAVLTLSAAIIDPCVSVFIMTKRFSNKSMRRGGKILTAVITASALIAVGFLFYYGEKEPVVKISDNAVKIESIYGLTVNFSDITAVSLLEKSMREIGTGRRTNGYGGFGDTLKGNFSSDKSGKLILFVKSRSAPTLCIEREGKPDVYVSYKDSKKTEALYQKIIQAIG